MIREINGNLLDAKTTYIAHQVNCQGKMGSGVAKAIRDKYPKVYEDYSSYCRDSELHELLGGCYIVPLGNGQSVANLFGQNDYGYDGKQYTDYDALKAALEILAFEMKCGETVAFPYKMASDRGGADWNKVREMIEEVFEPFDVEIWRLQ